MLKIRPHIKFYTNYFKPTTDDGHNSKNYSLDLKPDNSPPPPSHNILYARYIYYKKITPKSFIKRKRHGSL